MRARAVLALVAALALGGCDGGLTGIAAGVGAELERPRRPMANPADATFAFEPFPGVPGNLADDLLRALWRQSEAEGLNIVKRPGGPALFRIDGTLTAVSDDTNSVVFYVFDVRDVSGRVLHRIAGRQRSNPAAGDPWAGVATDDLDVIALRVAALLKAWLNADG